MGVDELYTTREVAEVLGLSISRTKAICLEHGLGTVRGRVRFLTKKELEKAKLIPRPLGRPKGGYTKPGSRAKRQLD